MLSQKHHILVIPGIGDRGWFFSYAMPKWQQKEIVTTIHVMPWSVYEPYTVKKQRLLQKIDYLYEEYGPISLIGISASGSAGLHAFVERMDKVHRFVAISAWLSERKHVFPPLRLLTYNYPEFKEAIFSAQEVTKSLSTKAKERILSIKGRWDGIIPLETSIIDGVKTITVPTFTHAFNTIYALTLGREKIQEFILHDIPLLQNKEKNNILPDVH